MKEQPGASIPPCGICGHKFHGLPCTVGIGQRTVWGAPAEVKTCECRDGVQTVLEALGLREAA